eukprot:CAMPEP_0174256600 /NCGR_PEP_ID=MMETSP0439-20130205/5819_1 /TAXON_ID=0 /ORGANISM="Stereomyxa ramosa, Strain Chinc5" /LENGTH=223 /DNA_ID=CAMNT_0015339291 /DNA_START=41 /DNA_END=712 /DNA_ORIENTATION=-
MKGVYLLLALVFVSFVLSAEGFKKRGSKHPPYKPQPPSKLPPSQGHGRPTNPPDEVDAFMNLLIPENNRPMNLDKPIMDLNKPIMDLNKPIMDLVDPDSDSDSDSSSSSSDSSDSSSSGSDSEHEGHGRPHSGEEHDTVVLLPPFILLAFGLAAVPFILCMTICLCCCCCKVKTQRRLNGADIEAGNIQAYAAVAPENAYSSLADSYSKVAYQPLDSSEVHQL